MPIVKIEKTKNYTFGLWELKENIEDLLKDLNPTTREKENIFYLKNTHRKKQNIAARLLLNYLSGKKVKLNYSDLGVPYCDHFKHISISHSNDYCVVAISKKKIGIDIQYFKKGILKLSQKYINEKEKLYSKNNIEKLYFIWSGKEAIYKTLNGLRCSFKKDIYIESVKKNKITNGYYFGDTTTNYDIYCRLLNRYSIVIATIK